MVIRIARRKPPKRCPQNKTSEVNQFRLTAETCERGTGYVGGWDFYEWSEGVAGHQYGKKTESYGREEAKKQESSHHLRLG